MGHQRIGFIIMGQRLAVLAAIEGDVAAHGGDFGALAAVGRDDIAIDGIQLPFGTSQAVHGEVQAGAHQMGPAAGHGHLEGRVQRAFGRRVIIIVARKLGPCQKRAGQNFLHQPLIGRAVGCGAGVGNGDRGACHGLIMGARQAIG